MNRLKIHSTIILIFILTLGTFSQIPNYSNPIAEQRADPWIYKTESGKYYLIATVPEYDRIVLRKAENVNALKNAEEKVLWRKHESGAMSHNIWAPELHRINNKWYIYFAAGEAGDFFKIRIYALSNLSTDPMAGEWKEEGQIQTYRNSFALDATTFEHNGKQYLVWAQDVSDGQKSTALVLSEMKDPLTLTGPEVVLSSPDFSWEKVRYTVNEGPAALKKNGKIFIAYSVSATNHNYCMGLLWINEDADLLKASNWSKSPGPVFYSNAELNRFGPGHNSFVAAEDGETTLMAYHARNYKEIKAEHELADPNRASRVRVLKWTDTGFPDFEQNRGD